LKQGLDRLALSLKKCRIILTIVTTAHQKESGIDLNNELSLPASAKYTADENSTTP